MEQKSKDNFICFVFFSLYLITGNAVSCLFSISHYLCVHVLQAKYKQNAEHDRATYTTVIDTPDIIHAQQIRNIVSQVRINQEYGPGMVTT